MNGVAMQIQQLEARVVQQLTQGLGRLEQLIGEHETRQRNMHEELKAHPLLVAAGSASKDADSAVKGVPIKVTIVGALGLRNADETGLSDPFCSCEVVTPTGIQIDNFRTKAMTDCTDAIWNQEHIFENFTGGTCLQFSVFDKDQSGSELLGRSKLANSQLIPTGFQGKLTLADPMAAISGAKIDTKKAGIAQLIVKVEMLGKDGSPIPAPGEKMEDLLALFTPPKMPEKKSTAIVKSKPQAEEPQSAYLKLRSIILGHRFETMSIMIILMNGMFIGIQADYAVKNPIIGSTSEMDIVELVFFIWFWSELIAKFLVGPNLFFVGPDKWWNYFDGLLMVSGTIQNLVGAGGVGASVLRVLRAGRVIKLAPFIKTNPFFKELRLMLYGTFACFRGLLWASLMLTGIMYLFGMVFMGAATSYMQDALPGDRTSKGLLSWYGSLPLTLRTLFRVISGGADWYDASYHLWTVGMPYGMLFLVYIYFVVFGVLNVLVGVFCESAMATASMDAEILAKEAEEEKARLFEQATVVLNSVDKDGSGTVTWEEFEMNLENPAVLVFLEAMQILPAEMQDIFVMIDDDSSGYVNINELMECCMKLKSGANLNTIVTLLYETKVMNSKSHQMLLEMHDFGINQSHLLTEVHELNRLCYGRLGGGMDP